MSIQSLDIARDLAHEGLSQAQAEAIARAIVQVGDDRADLMTKKDADQLKSELLLAIERSRNQTLIALAAVMAFFVAIDRLLS